MILNFKAKNVIISYISVLRVQAFQTLKKINVLIDLKTTFMFGVVKGKKVKCTF